MKRTKKWLFTLLAAITVLVLTACGAAGGNDEATVKVGVVGDQQEAWEHVKDVVKDEGINLEIVKFTDYVSPNQGLTDGSLDLNAYQTVEYLDNWNEEYGDDLVSIGYTHVEPMGLYSDKIKSIDDVEDGATVTLPNDKTNEARGLKVLEKAGLIKLNPDVDFPTAADDVVENPKNLKFEPIEAQQVPETKSDPKVQLAAINNNYAIEAGLSIRMPFTLNRMKALNRSGTSLQHALRTKITKITRKLSKLSRRRKPLTLSRKHRKITKCRYSITNYSIC